MLIARANYPNAPQVRISKSGKVRENLEDKKISHKQRSAGLLSYANNSL